MKFWEISDAFWEAVKPLIPQSMRKPGHEYQRESGGGRKPLDSRKVFTAILYVLKTGSQWKALPKDIYGSPSSIHAYFKKWEAQGFFCELWKKGLAEFEEMKGIAWEWTRDTARSTSEFAKKTSASLSKNKSEENSEKNEEGEGSLIWRPVISRRSREQAKALKDKAASLFTDKFKD